MEFNFNDEMFLDERTRANAAAIFPNVYAALDNERLRDVFQSHDVIANSRKQRARRLGLSAVVLTALALTLAAWEPALHGLLAHDGAWHWLPKGLAAVAGVAGIAGGLIGYFGLLFASRKREWLLARLATERLRQWQWQSFLADIPALASARGDNAAIEACVKRRDELFERFHAGRIEQVVADLPAFVSDHSAGIDGGVSHLMWLRPELEKPSADPPPIDDPVFREACRLYEEFRIRGQVQYTRHKLEEDGQRFATHAAVQARRLGNVALLSVLGILALHALVLVGVLGDLAWANHPIVHAIAVTAAIVALAGRTLEEGLQPHREVDRLTTYLQQIESARSRFAKAATSEDKLDAMRDFEAAAFNEMVVFLKTMNESRFVM